MILAPGVYDIPAAEYHADPVGPAPSLSSSVAKILLEKSPAHARLAHPKLNPAYEPKRAAHLDLGSAAHALLLEGTGSFAVIEADNYRTKAAQDARDRAHEAGLIPILEHAWQDVQAMAKAAVAQLARHEEAAGAFTDGKPEQTLVWQEGGVWCRARLDWLPNSGNVFYDLKTTGASANPDQWGKRQLFDLGGDVQAAFYRRGIKAVLGIENAHFRFCVIESEPPYALSVVALTPAALNMADRKVDAAIAWWRWCLEHDRWPGYARRVCHVDPPAWQENEWLGREERERLLADGGEDMRRLMMEWQSPLGVEGQKEA